MSSLYKGTLDKAEIDGGYGLGMAITNRVKSANSSLFSAVTAGQGNTGSGSAIGGMMGPSTSGSSMKRSFSMAVRKVKSSSSSSTVSSGRQFVFSDHSNSAVLATNNQSVSQSGFEGSAGVGGTFGNDSMSGFHNDHSMGASRGASHSAGTQSLKRSASLMHHPHPQAVTTIGFAQPQSQSSSATQSLFSKISSLSLLKRSNSTGIKK